MSLLIIELINSFHCEKANYSPRLRLLMFSFALYQEVKKEIKAHCKINQCSCKKR